MLLCTPWRCCIPAWHVELHLLNLYTNTPILYMLHLSDKTSRGRRLCSTTSLAHIYLSPQVKQHSEERVKPTLYVFSAVDKWIFIYIFQSDMQVKIMKQLSEKVGSTLLINWWYQKIKHEFYVNALNVNNWIERSHVSKYTHKLRYRDRVDIRVQCDQTIKHKDHWNDLCICVCYLSVV